MTAPAHLALDELVAYERGELGRADEERVEEHFFGCEPCTRALEALERLRAATAALVAAGRVPSSASASLVARAERGGIKLRSYRVRPGETVACTIAPEDAFVVTRLAGEFAGSGRVDVSVEATDLATGARESQRFEDVPVDRAAGEIVFLVPGPFVRSLPRSLWRYDVYDRDAGALLGSFGLDHTPWEERSGS